MRRTIAAVGRTLVTVGLLILLFVAYQLWGTGIFTARAQAELKRDFRAQLHRERPTDDPPPTGGSPDAPGATLDPTSVPAPAEGQVAGIIEISKIGARYWFVEGTSRDDLKKGPGHYPGTPMPGERGNAAIAGHRTTYLHPFYDLDQLDVGDPIVLTTLAGKFTYVVTRKPFPVSPSDFSVVANTPDAELTLTTCNPKYSASQRLIAKAVLQQPTSAPPPPPPPEPNVPEQVQQAGLAEGLSGQISSRAPAVVWGLIAALVGLAWWWVFRRWRHPAMWLAGVLPFLAVLFVFYVYLERVLPAGY